MIRGDNSMKSAVIRRASAGLRRLASLVAALGVLMALTAGAAFAQTPGLGFHADRYKPIDERGVNLWHKTFEYSVTDVALGNLSYTRSYYYAYEAYATLGNYGWRTNQMGVVVNDGYRYYVSVGGSTQVFTAASGTKSLDGSGATLAYSSGIYTHTSPSGVITKFSTSYNNNIFDSVEGGGAEALITEQTAPTGDKITWTYKSASCTGGTCYRLSSVNGNTGYQLKLHYVSDTGASNDPASAWQTVSSVTAVNNAVEYCSPTADTCTFSNNWPSVTYANPSSGVYTSTDQDGREWRYDFTTIYGGEVALEGIRSPESTTDDLSLSYDTYGRLIELSAGGQTWDYDFPSLYEIEVESSAGGGSRSFLINANLQFVEVTNASGTISFYYDTYGRRIVSELPSGVETETVWGGIDGPITRTIVPQSGSGLTELETEYDYAAGVDGSGNCIDPIVCRKPTTVTSPDGIVTTYTYSTTHGGVLTSTTASVTTTYDYAQVQAAYYTAPSTLSVGDSVYRLTSVSTCISGSSCSGGTSELKTSTAYQNHSSGTVPTNALPVSVTTGAGGGGGPTRTATTTYDNWSRPVSVNGPILGTDDTIYTLYAPDNSWVMTIGPDPDGTDSLVRNAVKTSIDENGNVTGVENATATDATISDPDGEDGYTLLDYATVAYDAYYRPIAQTFYTAGDTALSLANTSYDSKGRVECVAYRMNPSVFGTPTAACTHSTAGFSGPDRITKNVYNDKDQVITVISHLGTPFETESHYSYTASGKVATFTDANGNVTTYEYDGFDRLVKTRYPASSSPGTSSTSDYQETTYATNGRVSSIRLRDESEIGHFSYDSFGRISEYWIEGDGDIDVEAGEIKHAVTYDQIGRMLTTERSWYDSGVLSETTTNAYDALNLTSVTTPLGGVSRTVSYEYDAAGRRTKMTWPDSYYITYDWDVDSLNGIKLNGSSTPAAEFTYDQRGRRTALTYDNGASTSYDYNDRSRLDEVNIDMDGVGTTYDLTRTFTFNQANQIIQRSSTNATYDMGAPSSFGPDTWDANGLNQVTQFGSNTPTYDGRGNLANDDINTYTFDLENRLTGVESNTFAYDPLGRLSGVKVGTTLTSQFLYDGTDMIAEYDGSGNLTDRYIHGPGIDEPLVWQVIGWQALYLHADERGSITSISDASGNHMAQRTYDEYGNSSGMGEVRFGYTGQMWIPEAGLWYYKARFYSPTQGRFLSPDPIGYGDGPNMYAYVGNDPINKTDPTGLCILSDDPDCTEVDGITAISCHNTGGTAVYDGAGNFVECRSQRPIIDLPNRIPWSALFGRGGDDNHSGTGSGGGRRSGHRYTRKQKICDRELTPREQAFLIRRFTAPDLYLVGSNLQPNLGFFVDLAFGDPAGVNLVQTELGIPGGYVTTEYEGSLGTNVTTDLHIFVGTVEREIVNEGGVAYMTTDAYGNAGGDPIGLLRDAVNQLGGPAVFAYLDFWTGAVASGIEGCNAS
jgi:RHS repeat-associated protein